MQKLIPSVFLILFIFSAILLWISCYPIPIFDALTYVPYISGESKISIDWLWSAHNEHRIFLPRILYVTFAWLTNLDLRIINIFSLLLLSLGGYLIYDIIRISGKKAEVYDLIFPLIYANAAFNIETVGWTFQIGYTLPIFLCALFTWLFCKNSTGSNCPYKIGITLILLPLCGSAAFPSLLFFYPLVFLFIKKNINGKGIYFILLCLIISIFLFIFYFYNLQIHHKTNNMQLNFDFLLIFLSAMSTGCGFICQTDLSILAKLFIILLFCINIYIILHVNSKKLTGIFFIVLANISACILMGGVIAYTRAFQANNAHYTTLMLPFITYTFLLARIFLMKFKKIFFSLFFISSLLFIAYDDINKVNYINARANEYNLWLDMIKNRANYDTFVDRYSLITGNGPYTHIELFKESLNMMIKHKIGIFSNYIENK